MSFQPRDKNEMNGVLSHLCAAETGEPPEDFTPGRAV